VAAWNEAQHISKHIESFLALDYPNKELVLSAGGSDGTYLLAKRYAGSEVKVIQQVAGEGKQGALRRCFEEAKGQIIYLTDADCLLDSETFMGTIGPLIEGGDRVTTGTSRPLENQLRNRLVEYQWYRDVYWQLYQSQEAEGLLGRNCALRRSVLEELAAFDAKVPTGTDYYLGALLQEAGFRIRRVPTAIQSEYPETSRAYINMWRRWIKNVLIIGPRFGRGGEVRRTQLGVMASLGMMLLAVVTPLLGPIALIPLLTLLWWGFLQRVRHLEVAGQLTDRPLGGRAYLATFVWQVLDYLSAIMALVDLSVPGRRNKW
jgi:glycosyltransferase involved in cell wall biosynthesis